MSESNNNRQAVDSLQNELLDFCASDSLSEAGLRDIFQRHGLTPNNNPNVSNYDRFFLDACWNERVDEGIIQCFLEYFPEAAGVTNDIGSSPLHVACYNKNVTFGIIQLLIDAAPDSIGKVNNNGNIPLHILCCNMGIDETAAIEILKLLLEKCPESIRHTDDKGHLPIIHLAAGARSHKFCRVLIEAYPGSERISCGKGALPLHYACEVGSVATVEYLYKLYPDAVNQAVAAHGGNPMRYYPIHFVLMSQKCRNNPLPAVDIVKFLLDCDPNVKLQKIEGKSLLQFACEMKNDDSNMADIEILKLLLEKYPELIRQTDSEGSLPIHYAAARRSPEFCRVLIEAYPGCERISNDKGYLPLHWACARNTLATVEYFYNIYPDAINHPTVDGHHPISCAMFSTSGTNRPTAAVDIVRFLLECDPNVTLQMIRGVSLLHYACIQDDGDSNIDAAVQAIKAIYDAHPEVIEDDRLLSNIQHYHQQVRTFINGELVHARQARDHRQMTTPDEDGRLPLHRALQSNVRLGSIKLLVKGNPSAIRTSDNILALPLHVACQHHDSPSVVQYLIHLNATALRCADLDDTMALHYACQSAKYDTIAMLLERHDATSVSKRNVYKKLPIDLLWESDKVEDRESVEYTESVFRLLKAYPEMMMEIVWKMRQMRPDETQLGKKRKLDEGK